MTGGGFDVTERGEFDGGAGGKTMCGEATLKEATIHTSTNPNADSRATPKSDTAATLPEY